MSDQAFQLSVPNTRYIRPMEDKLRFLKFANVFINYYYLEISD